MIQLLVECNSPALAVTLSAVKKVLTIIQIVGPILLILAIALHVTQLMANPDDKKIPKKIFNSILATLFLFFIPLLINIVLKWMGTSFNFSACWNSIK